MYCIGVYFMGGRVDTDPPADCAQQKIMPGEKKDLVIGTFYV